MTLQLNPQQALFLLRLSFEEDGARPSAIYKDFAASDRKQLAEAGLVVVGKDPTNKRAQFATLTEAGYQWVADHLDSPLSKSNVAHVVLAKLLTGVQSQIVVGKFSFADLVRGSAGRGDSNNQNVAAEVPSIETSARRPEPNGDITRRILAACQELSGDGVYNVRIRLADLRSQLSDLDRADVDQALAELEREQAAAIMPLDDPREILPADEEAAFPNSIGRNRHILYLSRPH